MKQPNEDVCTDYEPTYEQMSLLGVDHVSLRYRDVLMQVAFHLQGASLRTPVHAGYFERISQPPIGSLVFEHTRGWWSRDPSVRLRAFGVLMDKREEWAECDDEYKQLVYEGRYDPTGLRPATIAHYVRFSRAPEDVCRWTSAGFTLIPIDRDDFPRP